MDLDDLKLVLPPPKRPASAPVDCDWGEIERELGLKIPHDYRAFVLTYGDGIIDGSIGVYPIS